MSEAHGLSGQDQNLLPVSSRKAKEQGSSYTARAHASDCLCFIFFLTVSALLIGVFPAVTRLLIFLQPSSPQLMVDPSSSLEILNVSSSSSNTTVTADWKVMLSWENTDGKAMSYNEINGQILFNETGSLSSTSVPPFEQPGKARKTIQVLFPNVSVQVNSCAGNNGSAGDVPCGAANLTIRLQAKTKYVGWTWPSKTDTINVVCEDMKVGFGSNTTRVGFGPGYCATYGRWERTVAKCSRMFWNYIYVASIFLCILALSL